MLDLRVVVEPDPELDAESAERLARQLRGELAAHDGVESVAYAAGVALPDGAKAADAVTVGALLVALSASGGVLTSLVEALRDWLGRSSRRHRISVTIDGDTIEIEGADLAQQRQLLEAYLRRHGGE